MRTKAFILFFPFAVFLFETASFIPAMKEACSIAAAGKKLCAKTVTAGQCPGNRQKSFCAKTKTTRPCASKEETGDKSTDNKCAGNPDCSTCPVCYTFIFQPQFEWAAQAFLFEKDYSLLASDNISSFIPDVWKPPNGFLYS